MGILDTSGLSLSILLAAIIVDINTAKASG